MNNVSMSVAANLSPILFLTFRELYGISYSELGFLILVNFITQLGVDLLFSFFSHKFNIEKTVKLIPVLTAVGFVLFAVLPLLFANMAYVGILIGTVIFSASSGLTEVLVSPAIAAIPSENTERELSALHSAYAWGVVGVVLFSTAFLWIFGRELWWVLALIFTVIPLISSAMFWGTEIPQMETPERASGAVRLLKNRELWLCVVAIFLGGAAECTMSQWSSGYLEGALGIPKVYGDVFGVAAFALMLGIGRTLYAKYGRNIEVFLLVGAIGATVCYFAAALSSVEIIGLLACAMTGLFTSILWPGNLTVASERFKKGGIFVYAIMAAGGDLGASVAPQLVGLVTDSVIASDFSLRLSNTFGVTPEQLGMKLGMLTAAMFPLAAVFVYIAICKASKRHNSANNDKKAKQKLR